MHKVQQCEREKFNICICLNLRKENGYKYNSKFGNIK